MTPEEKAIILVHKFELLIAISELMVYTGSSNFNQDIEDGVLEQKKVAKQCALICVGEILDQFPKKGNQYDGTSYLMFKGNIEYWEEVKQEIEKL